MLLSSRPTPKSQRDLALWKMDLPEFLEVSNEIYSRNCDEFVNRPDQFSLAKASQIKPLSQNNLTMNSVMNSLENMSLMSPYQNENYVSEDCVDNLTTSEGYKQKAFTYREKKLENEDTLSNSVDWCGNIKSSMMETRNKYNFPTSRGQSSHRNSTKYKSVMPASQQRPKTTCLASNRPISRPSINAECENIPLDEVEETVNVRKLQTPVIGRRGFGYKPYYRRSYPLRKGVTKKDASQSPREQSEYINLFEPALHLGIFEAVNSCSCQNLSTSSAKTSLIPKKACSKKQRSPRKPDTYAIFRQLQSLAQHQIVDIDQNDLQLNKVPPATPSSRPATASSHANQSKLFLQGSGAANQRTGRPLSAKQVVPVQRSTPSIPYVSGSSVLHQQRPFTSGMEFHARTLPNPKEFCDKVNKLRSYKASPRQYNSPHVDTAHDISSMELQGLHLQVAGQDNTGKDVTCRTSARRKYAGRLQRSQSANKSSCSTGRSLRGNADLSAAVSVVQIDTSRPIPVAHKVEDPDEELEKLLRWQEAVDNVDIARIFEHKYLPPNHAEKIDPQFIEKSLQQREAAIKIQRRYRRHLARKRRIYSRPVSGKTPWSKELSQRQAAQEEERQRKIKQEAAELNEKNGAELEKLQRIGPHVDIYQSFHPIRDGPTARQSHCAAVILQKNYRGWVTRKNMQELESKAKVIGFQSLKLFLAYYYKLLKQILIANGVRGRKLRFDFREMKEFIDVKRKLGVAFDSMSFDDQISEDDIMTLFHTCGFYPKRCEIRDILDSLFSHRLDDRLTREQVCVMLFHIYKPEGTGLAGDRTSSWMHPIIDGVDAESVVRPQEVGPVPLTTCIRLVLAARLPYLSFEKQVEVRRHLRQLDKMEKLKAVRESRARPKYGDSLPDSSEAGTSTHSSGPKIQWMKD